MVLEVFHVKEEDAVRVRHQDLRATTTALFMKVGVPRADAELATDVLVAADLRGVDSHGVSNMLRSYIQGYNEGRLNARPNWRIIRETPSTANIDCDAGLGIIIGPKAMDIAIDKAKKVGVGIVTMAHGRHMGMASYHAMMALKHDMIGTCMTAPGAQVLPTFGALERLGTNPIAVAAPAKEEPPFVFDAATSTVATNKIQLARRLDAVIPAGLIADKDGTPIMEEGKVPAEYKMLPMGSVREQGSHKGYGLACVVEVLCSVLSGSGFAAMNARGMAQHYVAAYSIEAFTDVEEFKLEIERRAHGIPLHKEVIQWYDSICGEMDVPRLRTV
ncbi:MAG: Ldh family oxidoreductase [Chloroflexi bacterium]|nr:Ldh family oxidoreductase [Chloroflexota bacterium]